jgi:hypothetical protein
MILTHSRNANLHILTSSCTQFNAPNNDKTELNDIKTALTSTASKSGLPVEFLFAIMMQESKGCVRVPTTNYGVRNPGLMQDHNGKATCNEGGLTTPCPSETITQMIEEGAGIGIDWGLTQAIAQSSASGVSQYYKGARTYNSGSVDASGNLGAGVATHCYASDIANRLLGWSDEKSACSEGSIASSTGSGVFAGTVNNPKPNPQTSPNTTGDAPKDTPAAPSTPAAKPNPPPSTTPTTSDSAPKNQAEGVAAGCKHWYTIKAGDDCSHLPVSFDKLRQLNTGIDASCSNLWLGYAYCTGI